MDALRGIGALNPSAATRPLAAPGGASEAGTTSNDFGQLLGQAIAGLSAESAAADQLASAFAVGAPLDMHAVMLQMNKASLLLSAGVAVRDRLLDAYHEIMRIQV
jgi:flagellar hook-basal body complex protein FliE